MKYSLHSIIVPPGSRYDCRNLELDLWSRITLAIEMMAQGMYAAKEAVGADQTIITNYVHPHSLSTGVPTEKILRPKVGGEFPVDDSVKEGTLSLTGGL